MSRDHPTSHAKAGHGSEEINRKKGDRTTNRLNGGGGGGKKQPLGDRSLETQWKLDGREGTQKKQFMGKDFELRRQQHGHAKAEREKK